MLLRFGITLVLSLIFGLERQKSHKPVGFGAFIFVAVGSCGLALTAMNILSENPAPLLGAIVTGIGFLGAGALIKTPDRIFGVTTAAAIWVFAIFGLLVGVGEYLISILVYISVWWIVLFDRHLERKGIGSYQKKLVIKTNKIIEDKELKSLLDESTTKHKIISVELDKKGKGIVMTYLIEGTKEDINKIPKKIFEKDWFDYCRIE